MKVRPTVLKAIADGYETTVLIADATGLTREKVRKALSALHAEEKIASRRLCGRGVVGAAPAVYRLTSEYVEPKTVESVLVDTVQFAIRTQPNSVWTLAR